MLKCLACQAINSDDNIICKECRVILSQNSKRVRKRDYIYRFFKKKEPPIVSLELFWTCHLCKVSNPNAFDQCYACHNKNIHVKDVEMSMEKSESIGGNIKNDEKKEEKNECAICMDNEIMMAIIPCGHYCICEECSRLITDCPICRRHCEQIVRIYSI